MTQVRLNLRLNAVSFEGASSAPPKGAAYVVAGLAWLVFSIWLVDKVFNG